MNRNVIGKSIVRVALSLLFVAAAGCSRKQSVDMPRVSQYESAAVAAGRQHLRIGVVPGPYGDMFMEAVYPVLREKGYTAELVYYNNYTLPNSSLADKRIDLNIFQHYRYLVNFKFEKDMSLSAIAEIPTASMGIFSRRHRSVDRLPRGTTVILPDDNTNLSRALMVLEDAGVIKLNPDIDKTKATSNDIVHNPRGITLIPKEAHTLVQLLPDHDLAVINGNFALSGGLNLAEALYNERLDADYFNVITVRTEDLGERFVEDIIRVTRSDEYRAVIMDTAGKYADFQRPRNFFLRMDRDG